MTMDPRYEITVERPQTDRFLSQKLQHNHDCCRAEGDSRGKVSGEIGGFTQRDISICISAHQNYYNPLGCLPPLILHHIHWLRLLTFICLSMNI